MRRIGIEYNEPKTDVGTGGCQARGIKLVPRSWQ